MPLNKSLLIIQGRLRKNLFIGFCTKPLNNQKCQTEEDIEHSIASVLDLVEETKAEIMNNSVKMELLNQRHSEEITLLLRKQSKEVGILSLLS